MSLEEYRAKRTFSGTPEPPGKERGERPGNLLFVVHKHRASHLHYDLRLELDGVLKSWAVPRGPSLDPSEKRLAMMVEDHPFDYGSFEGIIPEGNYGAGTVMIWDRGVYRAEDATDRSDSENLLRKGLEKGHLRFVLEGQRLKGAFSLVRMRTKEQNAWLLIKKKDAFADGGAMDEDDRSVASDRTMDDIARGLPDMTELQGLPLTPMPTHVKPMLATLIDKPFDRQGWFFEIKWDGYRMLAEVQEGSVRFYSRNDKTMNDRFTPVVDALSSLPLTALLDGELVVVDPAGKASFQELQNYMKTGRGTLVYYVFDLLYLEGRDVRDLPLRTRKGLLARILPDIPNIRLSEHMEGSGIELFRAASQNGIEGIVAKNGESTYRSGFRGREWLKIKAYHEQEAVIGGFTEPRGARKELGALILGVYNGGDLVYIGHAGGGLTEKELSALRPKLQTLATDASPFKKRPKTNMPATWVEPRLVCQVRFTEWTREGLLRHPVFLGLREDVDPREVRREEPSSLDTSPLPSPAPGSKGVLPFLPVSPPTGGAHEGKLSYPSPAKVRTVSLVDNRRVTVTNREKVFWPGDGYTKGNLIDYYKEVSPFILPYLKDRPESLNRYPDGIEGENFFQKNIGHRVPSWARTIRIPSEDRREINYLICDDQATLIYMANLGCIEINPWHSRVGSLDKPDYMVLDIDPLNVPFSHVVQAALTTRGVMEELGITSFCKTSGATGLHIYVPLAARYNYEQVCHFAHLLNTLVHGRIPAITSIERSPHKREGLVYLDFLQNGPGQTLAAAYCIRPRKGATVSTPLKWEEVNEGLRPEKFTMKNLPARLSRMGDLWRGVLGPGVDMEACLDRVQAMVQKG